jgi:hypothetical protein
MILFVYTVQNQTTMINPLYKVPKILNFYGIYVGYDPEMDVPDLKNRIRTKVIGIRNTCFNSIIIYWYE